MIRVYFLGSWALDGIVCKFNFKVTYNYIVQRGLNNVKKKMSKEKYLKRNLSTSIPFQMSTGIRDASHNNIKNNTSNTAFELNDRKH